MKTLSNAVFVIGLVLAATACVTDEGDEVIADEADTATATSASSSCREVKRFTYERGNAVYSWDVTTQLWDYRQFVDERKIGGGPSTYQQYRVSPVWSDCPHANENVRLTGSLTTLNGIHVCLPDGREEYHADFQRLLVPRSPFIVYNCD